MKGILYSMMAALLTVLILGLVTFQSQQKEKNIDINIRTNELKYFIESVETDLGRFLEITAKRALISAVSNVTVGGPDCVFDDASVILAEMIENGTIKGSPAPLVETKNLNTWKETVENIASNSGFYMEFQKIEMNITQNDSFNLLFGIKIVMNISDPDVSMGILRNISTAAVVSVEGLEDPIFPLNTLGRVVRVIRHFNFTNYTKALVEGSIASGSISGNATFSTLSPNGKIFVTDNMTQPIGTLNSFDGIVSESTYVPGGLSKPYIAGATGALTAIKDNERIFLDAITRKVWDLENLTLTIRNGYYSPSEHGASFLDRLEGNMTLSSKYKYGMETFVNLDDISNAKLSVYYSLSRIDYKYWNNVNGDPIRNGNYDPVFNNFKIDSEDNHKTIYGVVDLS